MDAAGASVRWAETRTEAEMQAEEEKTLEKEVENCASGAECGADKEVGRKGDPEAAAADGCLGDASRQFESDGERRGGDAGCEEEGDNADGDLGNPGEIEGPDRSEEPQAKAEEVNEATQENLIAATSTGQDTEVKPSIAEGVEQTTEGHPCTEQRAEYVTQDEQGNNSVVNADSTIGATSTGDLDIDARQRNTHGQEGETQMGLKDTHDTKTPAISPLAQNEAIPELNSALAAAAATTEPATTTNSRVKAPSSEHKEEEKLFEDAPGILPSIHAPGQYEQTGIKDQQDSTDTQYESLTEDINDKAPVSPSPVRALPETDSEGQNNHESKTPGHTTSPHKNAQNSLFAASSSASTKAAAKAAKAAANLAAKAIGSIHESSCVPSVSGVPTSGSDITGNEENSHGQPSSTAPPLELNGNAGNIYSEEGGMHNGSTHNYSNSDTSSNDSSTTNTNVSMSRFGGKLKGNKLGTMRPMGPGSSKHLSLSLRYLEEEDDRASLSPRSEETHENAKTREQLAFALQSVFSVLRDARTTSSANNQCILQVTNQMEEHVNKMTAMKDKARVKATESAAASAARAKAVNEARVEKERLHSQVVQRNKAARKAWKITQGLDLTGPKRAPSSSKPPIIPSASSSSKTAVEGPPAPLETKETKSVGTSPTPNQRELELEQEVNNLRKQLEATQTRVRELESDLRQEQGKRLGDIATERQRTLLAVGISAFVTFLAMFLASEP